MNFTGPSQKNTLSRVSVIQPKELHFHYFILKVPCFLQYFFQSRMKIIILWDQFHHLCYQDFVKKIVLLILQFTFFQYSQIILLPKVQTTVTQFLDMT